jgi:hypothetical protein
MLFARRYARKPEAVSRTEKLLGAFILLLAAGIIAAFAATVASDRDYLFDVDDGAYAGLDQTRAARSTENLFPAPGLAGWQAPTRVERFSADDLYVKIDGRAEAYLKFHVVGLTFGTYVFAGDAARTVDVYWYDMGAPANALGMYESEEAPGATPVAIGRRAYQVGGAVFFCKGSSYVQVLPSRLDDGPISLKIAEHLAERIEQE